MEIFEFYELAKLFEESGFSLYLVGGSVRDYLISNRIKDVDLVSNASLFEIEKILKPKEKFPLFESGKFFYKDYIIDITHLRKENCYDDFRHPKNIELVNNIKDDYERRDFTINALYMDKDGKIIDFSTGLNDLSNKTIKAIGNPLMRIKEDPLRILRAIRFAEKLNFKLDKELEIAIKECSYLLSELNFIKITQEINKFEKNKEELKSIFSKYDIREYIPLDFDVYKTKSISKFELEKYDSGICLMEEIQKNGSSVVLLKVANEKIDVLYNFKNRYKNLLNFVYNIDEIIENYSKNVYSLIPIFEGKIDCEFLYLNEEESGNIVLKDSEYIKTIGKKKRNKKYFDDFINCLINK